MGDLTAFIIGIPGRYRGEALEAQLHARDIAAIRIDGVIVDERRADLVDQRAAAVLLRRKILNAEIGCALAHRKVYREMTRRGDAVALVFEDDARMMRAVDHALITELLETPTPRVLLLSYLGGTAIADRQSLERVARHGGAVRTIVPPTIATAYALNVAAAHLLLDGERSVSHVADWPVRPSPLVEFYVTTEPVAAPDADTASTIGVRGERATDARLPRYARRLLAVSHVRWLLSHRYYGSYRAYVLHEFIRMRAFLNGERAAAVRSSGILGPVKSSRLDNKIAGLWLRPRNGSIRRRSAAWRDDGRSKVDT